MRNPNKLAMVGIWLVFLFVSSATALQCVDESNTPVDWYVMYKYPSGGAYSYMTSNSFNSWKLSGSTVNNANSILGRTLLPLYTQKNKLFYALYNDEPPEGKSIGSKGHTKGAVLADSTGGFWLVHSVPHFPQVGSSYSYPSTGITYGQSFLCISLDLSNLNKVGVQLQYNEPQIYNKNVLETLKSSLPELSKAANNVTNLSAPFYHISTISSKKGGQFTSFAKSAGFKKDLYEDLVAPTLKTDLNVETWLNGPGRLSSNCTKAFKVKNIQNINFKSFNKAFRSSEDHSKWAVSPSTSNNGWICIGDINRAQHQTTRGGGTVCLNNKQLAADYQNIVASVENCSKIYQN